MMRVLALDVGDKRIGIAVSDPLGITAQGLETYNRTGDIEKDAEYIANFAKKYVPVRLLFGMPRNMDGSYGFQSEKAVSYTHLDVYKRQLQTLRWIRFLCSFCLKRGMNRWVRLLQPCFPML